jgi:hypothetical protein
MILGRGRCCTSMIIECKCDGMSVEAMWRI